MSAFWDEDREGSSIGFDEFKKNLNSIQGGLRRTRKNTILREKMRGIPENEIESAIDSLDKREEKKLKKKNWIKRKNDERNGVTIQLLANSLMISFHRTHAL